MRDFPLHRLLPADSFAGAATIGARLLDLGAYPAAIPDASGRVRGEIYRVADPATWRALDSAEGPQYHRGETLARADGGGALGVWVYWYRGPLDRGVPIPGGDYRQHAPARARHGLRSDTP
jgi:gamma-glutamylcyclotransferase (GGCT)/AIG2-like uncharacterized protein YtfP